MNTRNQIIARKTGYGFKDIPEFFGPKLSNAKSLELGVLRLFTEHPASVSETYHEHFKFAFGFGSRMLLAGAACCIHGILPFLFGSTGSRTIRELHEVLRAKRSGPMGGSERGPKPDYQI